MLSMWNQTSKVQTQCGISINQMWRAAGIHISKISQNIYTILESWFRKERGVTLKNISLCIIYFSPISHPEKLSIWTCEWGIQGLSFHAWIGCCFFLESCASLLRYIFSSMIKRCFEVFYIHPRWHRVKSVWSIKFDGERFLPLD